MSEPFDPYHKLLGISQREQPPSLYRLLGLEIFESDREVIDAAANKQMAYLQACCNGDHGASAEQLLNEISNARLRLLNPHSKAAYDQQLYAWVPQQPDIGDNGTLANIAPAANGRFYTTPRVRISRKVRRKNSSNLAQWIGGAIASCLTVWAAWMLGFVDLGAIQWTTRKAADATRAEESRSLVVRSGRSELPNNKFAGQSTPNDEWDVPLQTANWSNPQSRRGTQPYIRARSSSTPVATVSGTRAGGMKDSSRLQPVYSAAERERLNTVPGLAQTSDATGSQTRFPAGRNVSASQKNNPLRRSVPSEDQLKLANQAVKSTLSSQINDAKSPHERQYLGHMISDLAHETELPAERYALMQTALTAFTDAGDFKGAMTSIDQLHGEFQIRETEQRLETMQKLEPLLYRPLDQVAMADLTETFIESVLLHEDYGSAREFCEIGQKLSQDLRNKDMLKKFSITMNEIETLQGMLANVQLARQRLVSEPHNAKANEFLGRFLCFGKSQWNDGLPYLSRGEDTTLRELAIDEMQPLTTATALESVAERWWEYSTAATTQPMVMRATQQRAVDTYRRAMSHGLSGLSKVAAEKRITAAQTDPDSAYVIRQAANSEGGKPKRPRTVPEEAAYYNGSWYLFSTYRLSHPKATAMAKKAGGRLVVVRSVAEHDFLVKNARRPLILGMSLRDGVWYDALNDRQYFFHWDAKNRQLPIRQDVCVGIDDTTAKWREFTNQEMYFAIEWGRE